jgi:hypothetical protein
MERVEMVGASLFVLRTRQLSATCWCCDVWERHPEHAAYESDEVFLLEDFGESELEAVAMALSGAYPH